MPPGNYYLTGNEALAEGAIAAGCRFYAGYPITPSSEIMERMAARLDEIDGGVFMQMEDEIASICAVIGAVWAGARGMTATSGPGFSLMQEAIGYAAITETPLVIADIQRAGPGTGQATKVGGGDLMQAKWGSHGDYTPIAMCPWSVQEMYDLTIRAFNLAETWRVPVFVMGEEAVGHLKEGLTVDAPPAVINHREEKGATPFGHELPDGVPPMPAFGEGEKLLITGSTHDHRGFRKTDDPAVQAQLTGRINDKIMNHRDEIVDTEAHAVDDADIVVVACGFTARSVLYAIETLRTEGLKVGLLRLKTIWPFPDDIIRTVCGSGRKILVPEMNRGQMAGEVMKYAGGDVIPLNRTDGRIIHPHLIMETIRGIA
ncbi:MAG: 2-oxoacid:acceptor oxidoreductase subunit alpha [Deltaproteobacteria bacterium]|nr:2-oxoacid:acceptor oxidoreductase subunit alpha [Candidatus Anaeroferrophillacea bacterium]